MVSLFKENHHVVVNIQADVAIGLVLHREATSEDDQAVPRLPKLVIELSLDVLRDVRVVRAAETLQTLDDGDDCSLSHLLVHVVSLNPDFSIGGGAIDFKSVAIITSNDYSLGAVRSLDTEGLNLCGDDFDH